MFKYLIAGAASALALTLAIPGYATAPQEDGARVILANGSIMTVGVKPVTDATGEVVASTEFYPTSPQDGDNTDRSRAYQDLVRIDNLERLEREAPSQPDTADQEIQLASLSDGL